MFYNLSKSDNYKKLSLLSELIDKVESRLKKQGVLEEGSGIDYFKDLEVRPYLRAKRDRISLLICLKMYEEAESECEDMIRLSDNDNLGLRYTLMALYSYFGDIESCKKLFEKYEEYTVSMLLPLACAYFKNRDNEESLEYLNKIKNVYLFKIIKGELKVTNWNVTMYADGAKEEAIVALHEHKFLLVSVPEFIEFIGPALSKNYVL